MRHRHRLAGGLLLLAILGPVSAGAQGGPPVPPPGSPRGARVDDARRDELEKRFRERLESIVKQRLELSDEQHARLRDVASRTEEARRALRREEYAARTAMRRELLAGSRANDARVADLLDAMPGLERRRLELMEQEQRELAKFLSPIQRARYFALQDELRRGMQELQRRRLSGGDSAGGPENPRSMRRKPAR